MRSCNHFQRVIVFAFTVLTMLTMQWDMVLIGKQIEDRVSRVTVGAKEVVEAAGDLVRRVYYNKLGLRTLVKPEWFEKKG
ncbi:unnamed protein product [Arabidopsis thaliana]|uniref:Transmembrane protein n=1 Tax=Arabidopsis thaliana TaxID=3702 RepID=A0A654FM85_ARATH|nr:unnamed protein product [Arabidopsis thaliana]